MLWILQILLAGMFLMAGFMKTTSPIAELSKTMPWSKDIPEALVRFIGASEFLGGVGLVLPSILRIKPILTPLAAAGIATIMVLAVFFHISRGETPAIGFNLTIGVVAAFIAWGRFGKAAIPAKS